MFDEHRIFRQQAKQRQKGSLGQVSYQELFTTYKDIYTDYLTNLLINLFDYKNVPQSFNTQGLEYLLRMFGYANVVAVDEDNIYTEGIGFDTPSLNFSLGTLIGGLGKANTSSGENVGSLLSEKGATCLTRMNANSIKAPVYVTIPNKFSFYTGSQCSDAELVDTTASFLAEIKASVIANLRLQKSSFIGFTKDANLSSKIIYDKLMRGEQFIQVDSDIAEDDIRKIITTLPLQMPNLSGTLADSWNTAMNEFMQMTGINASSVDKKERLTAEESVSDRPKVSASLNVYLKARQSQLDLLNKCLGTDIKVELSSDGLDDLVNFAQAGTGQLTGDDSDD